MRELIKHIAEVIRDLQTLNLLEKENVTTTFELDEQTTYILTVKVTAPEDTLILCLETFQELRRRFSCSMCILENNRYTNILSVRFAAS